MRRLLVRAGHHQRLGRVNGEAAPELLAANRPRKLPRQLPAAARVALVEEDAPLVQPAAVVVGHHQHAAASRNLPPKGLARRVRRGNAAGHGPRAGALLLVH